MSFDLMFFDLDEVPKTNKKEFVEWYYKSTDWKEGKSYDDPSQTTPILRNIVLELLKKFPAINGKLADKHRNPDNLYLADYVVSNNLVYIAFSWDVAEEAFNTCVQLIKEFPIGFYNPSSEEGEVLFAEKGELFYLYND